MYVYVSLCQSDEFSGASQALRSPAEPKGRAAEPKGGQVWVGERH